MNGARAKSLALLAGVAGAGLTLLAWSQTWFELRLLGQAGIGTADVIAVGGGVASPALAALGLAGLALVAAIAIAGPVLRVVLAVIQALLGGSIILASSLAIGDPVGAVAPAVTEATGVAGTGPTAELVASASATFWPTAAMLGGALVVIAGLVALSTTRQWPGSSRRYSSARVTDAATGEPTTLAAAQVPQMDARRRASDRAVDAWDELSRGDDPTEAGMPGPGSGIGDDVPHAEGEGPTDPSR
ncbi:Trp biosynthesis-associated membrane protein [Agromyces salentinus]|uniref:Trp biosynthesis-associated membrane protein n=1 Tax=Agromyces salentinus TaxID=269421 RepID=A0ABN2N081_9MICO|nr:Trp biosynthesis-associated membrane protein [Agromyces salentinus]